MSDLKVNTISDAAGTGPATLTKQSAAKAWWKYTQTVPVVNDSFNISSITDLAIGVPELNMTNSMASVNYVFQGGACTTTNDVFIPGAATGLTISTFRYWTYGASTGTTVDNITLGTVHGDLA